MTYTRQFAMAKVSFDFTGNNYLITGASSGIGKQIALDLAYAGANILVISRRENELKKLQTEYPKKISIVSCDVCDKQTVKSAVENFIKEKGLFNGFVHAAGIYDFSPINIFDKNEFQKMMDVNFWAGIDIIQFISKKKYSANEASFVMFSSVSALKGEKGALVYSASKAAVSTAVKSIAKELYTRKIRVNAIMPGPVATPMTQVEGIENLLERIPFGIGNTTDVSYPVLFLLSDGAKWITGTDFIVDGGYINN